MTPAWPCGPAAPLAASSARLLTPCCPSVSLRCHARRCGFGHTCKFHHPELEEAELAGAAVGPAAVVGTPPSHFPPMPYMQYGSGPHFPMPPFSHPYSGEPGLLRLLQGC